MPTDVFGRGHAASAKTTLSILGAFVLFRNHVNINVDCLQQHLERNDQWERRQHHRTRGFPLAGDVRIHPFQDAEDHTPQKHRQTQQDIH